MSKQSSFPELEVSTSTTFIDVTDGTTPKNRKIKVSNLISSQLSNPSNFKAAATSLVSDELEKRVSNIEFNKYKDDTSDVLKAKLDKVDHTFDKLTSHPTTVQGYGITDAYNTGNANRTDTDWTAKDFIGNKLKLGKSILEYDEENDAFKVNGSIYATGGISCCGTGPNIPSGGGGLIESVYNSTQLDGNYYDTKLTDTFNAFTISSIHKRVKNIEDTPASPILTFNTTGTGNVVTSVTRVGDIVTSDKGVEAWTKTNLNPSDYLKVNSIADWARQPNKPSYGFNEIGDGSFNPLDENIWRTRGRLTAGTNFNNLTNSGAYDITGCYDNNAPHGWSKLLNFNNGIYGQQISFPLHSNPAESVKYRNNDGISWGQWITLWDSQNSNKSDVDWACKTLNCSSSNVTTNINCGYDALANGSGLSLYGGLTPEQVGIHYSNTATFGKHGLVQGDYANYYCVSGDNNRGHIFRTDGTNVASISNRGVATFSRTENYGIDNGYELGVHVRGGGTSNPTRFPGICFHQPGLYAGVLRMEQGEFNLAGDIDNKKTELRLGANRYVWHSDNFSPSNYLPLSGGTITDTLTVNNGITAPSIKLGSWEIVANGNSLSFKLNGVEKGTMTDSGFVSSGGITALN